MVTDHPGSKLLILGDKVHQPAGDVHRALNPGIGCQRTGAGLGAVRVNQPITLRRAMKAEAADGGVTDNNVSVRVGFQDTFQFSLQARIPCILIHGHHCVGENDFSAGLIHLRPGIVGGLLHDAALHRHAEKAHGQRFFPADIQPAAAVVPSDFSGNQRVRIRVRVVCGENSVFAKGLPAQGAVGGGNRQRGFRSQLPIGAGERSRG